ncbi:MAG: glycosyltransferase [Bacteroidales bacterium]|jgi:glycosyltransferase involved in cell wall biosynthesis|nr:glycosyltransferase [Bacteroidales bacterium]
MKKTIYIIDFIGIHSGLQYYDDVFAKELSTIEGIEVHILSNYSDDPLKKPFLKNFFSGNLVTNTMKVFQAYISILYLMVFKRHTHFILLAYGGFIDILFMTLAIFFKNITIDVHDVYALDFSKNKFIRFFLDLLYRYFVKSAIIHSERSLYLLQQINYQKKLFEIPHFKYSFKKKYNESNIHTGIINATKTCRIKILFFGYIRYSKGIDILLDSFNLLPVELQNKFHLIIAGNDTNNILNKFDIQNNDNISIFSQYINDDELVYLFSNVNYIMLPYKEISQSGILEMAFYFQKPIVASRISYFEKILNTYPSFGLIFNNTVEDLAQTISLLPSLTQNFYDKNEVRNFEQRDKIYRFLSDFSKFIKNE